MTLSEAREILFGNDIHFILYPHRDENDVTSYSVKINNESSDMDETNQQVDALNVLLNNFLNQSQQFVLVY